MRNEKVILSFLVAITGLTAISHAVASSDFSKNACNTKLTIVTTDEVKRSFLRKVVQPEVKDFLREKGPSGQSLAAHVKPDGSAVAFGTERAIQNAKLSVAKHGPLVMLLGGAFIKGKDFHKYQYEIANEAGAIVPVKVEVIPILCGSAVHSDSFSDLDIETTIEVNYEGFREEDLHNKNSLAAKALARFLQDYAREVSLQNVPGNGPPYLLEVKVGEYDHVPSDQLETKSRAIKWTMADLAAGSKQIATKDGSTKAITLEEAVTSETRVKADWVVKVKIEDESFVEQLGITHKYVDANVLFLFAGKSKNNEAVLRVSRKNNIPEEGATGGHLAIEGSTNLSPMRISTVAFTAEHAKKANRLSVVTPNTPIFYTHIRFLSASRTYLKMGEKLKILKRLQRRLHYWNDVSVFKYYCENKLPPLENCDPSILPANLETLKVYDDIEEILSDKFLKNLVYLREVVRTLLAQINSIENSDTELAIDTYFKARVFFEDHSKEAWEIYLNIAKIDKVSVENAKDIVRALEEKLKEFSIGLGRGQGDDLALTTKSETLSRRLKSLIEYIDLLITGKLDSSLTQFPYLNEYILFVLHPSHHFNIEKFNKQKLFITVKPKAESEFLNAYSDFLSKISSALPMIDFSHPEDLHMTLQFLGRMTPQVEESAKNIVEKYNLKFKELLKSKPLILKNGSLQLIGSNHNQLGIVFEDMPSEYADLVQHMKYELVRAGIAPDRHLNEFLPHISLGFLGNSWFSPHGKRNIHSLFAEGVPPELQSVEFTSNIELLAVNEAPASSVHKTQRYISLNDSGEIRESRALRHPTVERYTDESRSINLDEASEDFKDDFRDNLAEAFEDFTESMNDDLTTDSFDFTENE